jgi:6-pyruvoyltetrahydropterin/6-carboxytetrahydropterin synthase
MYKLTVNKSFTARHFLIGGNWGPENQEHSHRYRLEIELEGRELDGNGFLIDITVVEGQLDGFAARYGEHLLNNLPEFQQLNPSIENFARLSYQFLSPSFKIWPISGMAVKVWEDEKACVTYRE